MVHKNLALATVILLFAVAPGARANDADTPYSQIASLSAGSVKRFGAVGDGKADDTAAVEAAFRATEGAVFFPAGEYRLTRTIVVQLDRRGRTSLVGDGTACVVMAGPGPAFHLIGTHDGTADPDSVRSQVWQRQRLPVLTGLEIRGSHPEATGLRLEGTMQATLTGLLIRRCAVGIHLVKRNRNLIVDRCHVYDNGQVGIDFDHVNLHQAIIANSHISYNAVAGIRLIGGEMRNFQIVGNDIEYNYDPNAGGAADILIDSRPVGSSFREGTIAANTIQAVPSPNGANVRILGGKNLRTGGLLTISGNLIGSQTYNVHLADCRGVTICGNSLYSAAEHTLWLQSCTNVTAGDNTIDWNPDHKNKSLVDGILIEDCKAVTLSDTIIENSFQGSSEVGGAIDVKASRDVAIVDCQVLDFKFRGITLTDAVRCRVVGCSVIERRRQPAGPSITVKGGRDNLVADNMVNRAGISAPEAAATVRGNLEVYPRD